MLSCGSKPKHFNIQFIWYDLWKTENFFHCTYCLSYHKNRIKMVRAKQIHHYHLLWRPQSLQNRFNRKLLFPLLLFPPHLHSTLLLLLFSSPRVWLSKVALANFSGTLLLLLFSSPPGKQYIIKYFMGSLHHFYYCF